MPELFVRRQIAAVRKEIELREPEIKYKMKIVALLVVGVTLTALKLTAQSVFYTTDNVGQGNIVENGGFEQGDAGWGWTYNYGVWFGFPDAAEGGNFGEVDGTIYQDLAMTPGQQYQLQFALAGNSNISSSEVVNVLWGGNGIGNASWNPAGHNINSMGWVWSDFDVTASSFTTRLTFANPYVGDGSGRIDLVDAISVVAIPEPSRLLLLGLGWLALSKRQR